jgi:hypothetical protein
LLYEVGKLRECFSALGKDIKWKYFEPQVGESEFSFKHSQPASGLKYTSAVN